MQGASFLVDRVVLRGRRFEFEQTDHLLSGIGNRLGNKLEVEVLSKFCEYVSDLLLFFLREFWSGPVHKAPARAFVAKCNGDSVAASISNVEAELRPQFAKVFFNLQFQSSSQGGCCSRNAFFLGHAFFLSSIQGLK